MKPLAADAREQLFLKRERFYTIIFLCFFCASLLLYYVTAYFLVDAMYVIRVMLCIFWAESIRARVLSKRFAALLSMMAYSLAFLIFLQIIRYDIVPDTQVTISRYLWYLYYVPLLSTCLFSFLAALSECVRENIFRAVGTATTGLMLLLMLLVLTNDLHRMVFSFTVPLSLASGDEGTYSHGILFYVLSAGYLLLMLISFCLLLAQSLKKRRRAWKAYVVSICAVLLYISYAVYYVRYGAPSFFGERIQFQEILMLASLLFWEPVLRTDYVFWRKEVAAGERMDKETISGEGLRVEEESARYAAQNAVYDGIGQAVSPYLTRIEGLMNGTENDFRARMAHTALEGVFVKRTANLMLSGDAETRSDGNLSIGELALSVKETLDAYALCGAKTAFADRIGRADTEHPAYFHSTVEDENRKDDSALVNELYADAQVLTKTYERFCARLETLYENRADVRVQLLPDEKHSFVLEVNGETV